MDESNLQYSTGRFFDWKKVLDRISEGVMITDNTFHVLYVNLAFTRITGYDTKEVIFKAATFINRGCDDSLVEEMWASIHNTGCWQGERWSKRYNNDKYIEKLKICALKNDLGQIGHYLILLEDATENRRKEEQLLTSERLSLVSQLAAGVAHEIRNPLTALRGFIQLLHSGEEKKESKYYQIMLEEIDRLTYIVNEFLLLAKPHVMNVKKQELKKLLHNVITLLQTHATMNNVQILTEFEEDIPYVKGEENQLKQVFINLLKNAVEAMPYGGDIVIYVQKFIKNYVLIRIVDQGEGIPDDKLSKIGEPFFSTKEKGTGLGFMICQKIIKEHQGSIFIESKQGQGTTVEVLLPVFMDKTVVESA